MAKSLATDVLRRLDNETIDLPRETRAALARAQALDEQRLKEEYTVNYSGNDLLRLTPYVLRLTSHVFTSYLLLLTGQLLGQ